MTLKNYSREELEATSMIELAGDILYDAQQAQNFNDLFNKAADLKGMTDEQKQEFIAQFYTDLTIDGRFLTVQSGIWGLKRWYPVEQMDQFVTEEAPKKSKKKKKKQPKEPVPSEEEVSETQTDQTDDNVEVLTNKFEDEAPDETDEFNEPDGFDDEIDEADDDFDDDDDEKDDDSNDEADDSDDDDEKEEK